MHNQSDTVLYRQYHHAQPIRYRLILPVSPRQFSFRLHGLFMHQITMRVMFSSAGARPLSFGLSRNPHHAVFPRFAGEERLRDEQKERLRED